MQDVEKTEIQSQTSPKRRRRRNRMRPLYGLLVAALVIGVGVSLSMTVFSTLRLLKSQAMRPNTRRRTLRMLPAYIPVTI